MSIGLSFSFYSSIFRLCLTTRATKAEMILDRMADMEAEAVAIIILK